MVTALSGFCVQAEAQDTVPPIKGLNLPDEAQLPIIQGKNRFTTQNPYLEDTLELQYQISLLERMVERQAGIARLEKNYMEMGVSFNQPTPPHGICTQIPANIPCFRAYPDLYDIILPEYSMLELDEESLIIDENDLKEPLAKPVANVPPVPAEPDKPASLAMNYRWTEILCGGGVCSAVLVKTTDTNFRRTMQEESVLEDGTITISTISASGVTVKENGKEIELLPALSPAEGGPSSPVFDPVSGNAMEQDQNPQGEFMRNVLDSEADLSNINNFLEQEIPDEPPLPVPVEEPIEDPGAPLGPTGLF